MPIDKPVRRNDESDRFIIAHLHGKEAVADEYRARITELEAENKGLRTLLFLRHGCGFEALYGDDGELQCRECGIDFKRMLAEDISARFEAIGRASCAERDADIARLEAEIKKLDSRTSGSIRVGGYGCLNSADMEDCYW